MKALHFNDPLHLPKTCDGPAELLAKAAPLEGSPGQAYIQRRGIPVEIAKTMGLLYAADYAGRAAVIVPMHDKQGRLCSVHGRYLETIRGQNKMLTVGQGDGLIIAMEGWHSDPLIIVEGLFDALSLAVCGFSCVATIGRQVTWLPEISAGNAVWLAFDTGRPGEHEAMHYQQILNKANTKRLTPPPNCKDWNTALVKRGEGAVRRWLLEHIQQTGNEACKRSM